MQRYAGEARDFRCLMTYQFSRTRRVLFTVVRRDAWETRHQQPTAPSSDGTTTTKEPPALEMFASPCATLLRDCFVDATRLVEVTKVDSSFVYEHPPPDAESDNKLERIVMDASGVEREFITSKTHLLLAVQLHDHDVLFGNAGRAKYILNETLDGEMHLTCERVPAGAMRFFLYRALDTTRDVVVALTPRLQLRAVVASAVTPLALLVVPSLDKALEELEQKKVALANAAAAVAAPKQQMVVDTSTGTTLTASAPEALSTKK